MTLITTLLHIAPLALNKQPVRLKTLHPLQSMPPTHPILRKLLHRRLQPRLVQRKIIHAPNPQDTHPRKRRANAIHQAPTRLAEEVRHRVVLAFFFDKDGLVLAPRFWVGLAAEVREVRVEDGEVGGEHGGCEFVAVGAIAEEAANEAGTMGGLREC